MPRINQSDTILLRDVANKIQLFYNLYIYGARQGIYTEWLLRFFFFFIWKIEGKRGRCPWLNSQVLRVLKILAAHQLKIAGTDWWWEMVNDDNIWGIKNFSAAQTSPNCSCNVRFHCRHSLNTIFCMVPKLLASLVLVTYEIYHFYKTLEQNHWLLF